MAVNRVQPQIRTLYGLLERMTSNPMVTLNRAAALAMVRRRGCSCWKASTGHWPATTAWTPCGRTCLRWPATTWRRLRTTGPRPASRPAWPSAHT